MTDQLKQFENVERQWFAFASNGNMYALGDCGDYDSADEVAQDMLSESVLWVFDAATAREWVATFRHKGVSLEIGAGDGEPGPTIDRYQRDDGSWVVHVDTHNVDENSVGPLITVYINDDTDNPVYDNRAHCEDGI